jgi:hypothetical protein
MRDVCDGNDVHEVGLFGADITLSLEKEEEQHENEYKTHTHSLLPDLPSALMLLYQKT